jgi:LysM repeat protein
LSGTPVPFPSPTALPELGQGTGNYTVKAGDTLGSIASNFGVTVDELMKANDITDPGVIYIDQKLIIPGVQSSQSVVGQRMEGSRGIFSMTTYRKADESQRVEYGLNLNPNESPFFYVILEGADLQEIQTYHNRPVDIWGTIERVDQNGNPVVKVERYEIPFPDLNFQLLQGKQRMTQIDGLDVALFTAPDGTTYAQLMTFGVPDTTILGLKEDVILETGGSGETSRPPAGCVQVYGSQPRTISPQ